MRKRSRLWTTVLALAVLLLAGYGSAGLYLETHPACEGWAVDLGPIAVALDRCLSSGEALVSWQAAQGDNAAGWDEVRILRLGWLSVICSWHGGSFAAPVGSAKPVHRPAPAPPAQRGRERPR